MPDDAAAMAALHAASFPAGWPESDFSAWLSSVGHFGVIAVREREAVACVLARETAPDAEILTIAVAPSARGQGLGRAVLEAVTEQASARKAERLLLEVAIDNAAALALYKRSGFVEIARRKHYFQTSSGAVDALVLACFLDRVGKVCC